MDINKILFRASSMGELMGEKGLGDTGKKRARQTYREYTTGRTKEFKSKYTTKGNNTELEGIRMVSDVLNATLYKNNERVSNQWFTGECDVDAPLLDAVIDIKSSWDIFTFDDARAKPNKDYYTQGQIYLELYGRTNFILANVLIDAPDSYVVNQLYKESFAWPDNEVPPKYKVKMITDLVYSRESFDRLIQMEGLHMEDEAQRMIELFVEIPENERVYLTTHLKNSTHLELAKKRVEDAREYLIEFYKL